MGVERIGEEDLVFTKDYMCTTLDKAIALLKELAHIKDAASTGE